MAWFKYDESELAEGKRKLADELAPRIGGEELVAVGLFRRPMFGASYAAGKLGGALPSAAINLARKKRAGGMPDRLILAVTPTRLYAFSFKPKGRGYRVKDEAAVWERSNLECSRGRGGNMTTLTIASPSEGEKATLVGSSVEDDPWSQEVIGELTGTPA